VNTAASVDHHCSIGDAVHIAPGVRLAGNVKIGQGAWVGIGATIIENVRIGDGAVIGAGSVVVEDIPDAVVAYGVPARVVGPVHEVNLT
jgi:acetyltransferase EpsM